MNGIRKKSTIAELRCGLLVAATTNRWQSLKQHVTPVSH